MSEQSPVITAIGIAVPGLSEAAELLAGPVADAEPIDPAAHLGRKGMRYKDHATKLALIACKDALTRANLWTAEDGLAVDPDSVAVLASSNFGNIQSVADVARVIAENGGTRLVSPVATPLLSSNNVCADIAIRFTLRGPNMMVCNGATSGLDAVRWATTWMRGKRVRYVLVVGVEPDNEVTRGFCGAERVFDGAAAFVLEWPETAAERGLTPLAEVGRVVRTGDLADCVAGFGSDGASIDTWLVPEGGADEALLPGVERIDLAGTWGLTSGAHGVLQVAVAATRVSAGAGAQLAVAGGPGDDASAGVLVSAVGG